MGFGTYGYRPGPSLAFTSCETCNGRGFLRNGDFADRSFPRCKTCEGIGQIYLEKSPEKPPEKPKT